MVSAVVQSMYGWVVYFHGNPKAIIIEFANMHLKARGILVTCDVNVVYANTQPLP